MAVSIQVQGKGFFTSLSTVGTFCVPEIGLHQYCWVSWLEDIAGVSEEPEGILRTCRGRDSSTLSPAEFPNKVMVDNDGDDVDLKIILLWWSSTVGVKDCVSTADVEDAAAWLLQEATAKEDATGVEDETRGECEPLLDLSKYKRMVSTLKAFEELKYASLTRQPCVNFLTSNL